jgi:hypothetical protein
MRDAADADFMLNEQGDELSTIHQGDGYGIRALGLIPCTRAEIMSIKATAQQNGSRLDPMIDEAARGAYCANCHYAFGEGSPPCPCPTCGSESRHVYGSAHMSIGVCMTAAGLRREKHRRPGQRPTLEIVHGTELHHATGELREVDRVVDHVHNRYKERITGPDGYVIREIDEPLTEHWGRGTANHAREDNAQNT